jgi:hypothetical protein
MTRLEGRSEVTGRIRTRIEMGRVTHIGTGWFVASGSLWTVLFDVRGIPKVDRHLLALDHDLVQPRQDLAAHEFGILLFLFDPSVIAQSAAAPEPNPTRTHPAPADDAVKRDEAGE